MKITTGSKAEVEQWETYTTDWR